MATGSNKEDSLERYIAWIHSIWGDGKDPQLPLRVKGQLEKLLTLTNPLEPWIVNLIRKGPPASVVYRDQERGFVLTGHVQQKGHSSPPHDHGPYWVLYGVYHGVTEITTYKRTDDRRVTGLATLAERELHRLKPGVVMFCAPGEILSTLAAEHSVIFRFLSSDLNKVQRYRYLWDGAGFRQIPMRRCLDV